MTTERTNLKLTELSLVPKGANPLAKAPLFKADTSNGDKMEEVEKMSEGMDKKIKDYMKAKGCDRKTAEQALMKSFDEVETLKAENERLRKGLIDNGFVIKAEAIEKKAPVEYIEVEGEKIEKSSIPAPILKRLEEAETERKESILKAKAKETLPNFKEDVAVALMKFDLDEAILEALKAADALFSEMTDEIGKQDTNGDMLDPMEKINKMAKAHAEENSTTFAKAYAAVMKTSEAKELYKLAQKEK